MAESSWNRRRTMSLDLSPSIVENRVSEWKSSRLPGAKWPTRIQAVREFRSSSSTESGNILLEWSGRDQWDHTHPDDVLYQWWMGDANLCGLCSWAGICGPLCSRHTGMVSSRLFGCAGRFRALLPLFRPFVIQRSRRWLCFSPCPGRGALCPPQFEGCLGTAPYLRVSANPGTIRPGNPSNHHQL